MGENARQVMQEGYDYNHMGRCITDGLSEAMELAERQERVESSEETGKLLRSSVAEVMFGAII
jgi:hypothetical protein